MSNLGDDLAEQHDAGRGRNNGDDTTSNLKPDEITSLLQKKEPDSHPALR